VPASLVENHHDVGVGRDGLGKAGQEGAHRSRGHPGQHEREVLPLEGRAAAKM
jgi:hypothetical protein